MRVKHDKKTSRTTYNYKGDLSKAIKDSEKELLSKQKDIEIYRLIFEKAEREYLSRFNRIKDLQAFINLAKKELNTD